MERMKEGKLEKDKEKIRKTERTMKKERGSEIEVTAADHR